MHMLSGLVPAEEIFLDDENHLLQTGPLTEKTDVTGARMRAVPAVTESPMPNWGPRNRTPDPTTTVPAAIADDALTAG